MTCCVVVTQVQKVKGGKIKLLLVSCRRDTSEAKYLIRSFQVRFLPSGFRLLLKYYHFSVGAGKAAHRVAGTNGAGRAGPRRVPHSSRCRSASSLPFSGCRMFSRTLQFKFNTSSETTGRAGCGEGQAVGQGADRSGRVGEAGEDSVQRVPLL